MTPEQRRRAGRAVEQRIAELHGTQASIARASRVDRKTLRSLIRGEHWPTDAVQSRIETVLNWRQGELTVRAVRDGTRKLTDVDLAAELLRRLTEHEAICTHKGEDRSHLAP